jgi:hypothetical protein
VSVWGNETHKSQLAAEVRRGCDMEPFGGAGKTSISILFIIVSCTRLHHPLLFAKPNNGYDLHYSLNLTGLFTRNSRNVYPYFRSAKLLDSIETAVRYPQSSANRAKYVSAINPSERLHLFHFSEEPLN